MGPVFSLVLDEDVSDEIALRYPELYKDLVKVILNKVFGLLIFCELNAVHSTSV